MGDRVTSPAFVGRDAELDRLHRALEEAGRGEPRVVLLGGEAGVGKTRLLAEFAEQARGGGARVLSGGCIDLAEGMLPYGPVVEALRGLPRDPDWSRLRSEIGASLPHLAPLIPSIGAPGGGVQRETAPGSRTRLFEALLDLLGPLGRGSPVALMLDDLHWADGSSRDLVAFLVHSLVDERLLILGAYRSDELRRGDPVLRWIAGLRRQPPVTSLELSPLLREEVAAQLAGILGDPPEPELVDRVFQLSGGNALFAEELALVPDPTAALPTTIRDLVLARVEACPAPVRELLRVAAVAGSRFEGDLVAGVTEETHIDPILRDAVERHILVPREGGYAFRHPLVREVIYLDLIPGERARLHAALASVLAARSSSDDGSTTRLAALAHHWDAAGDRPRALLASVEAGTAAQEVLAHPEAHRQFERALDLWERVREPEGIAPLDHLALLRRTAEVAAFSGDATRAVELLRRVVAHVDPESDPELAGMIHERLGWFLVLAGEPGEESFREFERAEELLPRDRPTRSRARVLAELALALVLWSRIGEARTRAEEAIEVARAAGARGEEAIAGNTLAICLSGEGQTDAALREIVEARRIAAEAGEPEDLARTFINHSHLLSVAGRLEAAAEVALEGARVARRLGLESMLGSFLLCNAASSCFELGRWEEADRLVREVTGRSATEFSRRFVDLMQVQLAVARRGGSAPERDGFERAEARLRRFGQPQLLAPLLIARAEAALWERRPEEARPLAAEALELGDAVDPLYALQACWMGLWAEADRSLGAPKATTREAHRDGNRLRARARSLAESGPPIVLAHRALCEGEHSRLRGRSDPDAWRAAAEQWETLRAPYPAAYARWREAEAVLEGGGSRTRAERILRDAYRAARSLGAGPLAGEVEALARRGRVDLTPLEPPAAPPKEPDAAERLGLTPREREVLQHLADGLSNREIAEALFISPKTASVHVSNLLRKLGVESRLQAASAAHRLGLLGEPES